MSMDNFSELTEPQRIRDYALLEQFRSSFVAPLIEEICSCVNGYASMSDRERLVALLRLNEEHALEGDWLLVDFGIVDGCTDTITAFFSGTRKFTGKTLDGARTYLPLFVDSEFPGLPNNSHALILNNLTLYDDEHLEQFKELPICFRLAVIARTIQQNFLVSRASACRFAAGFDDEIEIRRWQISALNSGQIQRFGWHIDIRDTSPGNEFVKELARKMRSAVKSGIESYGYIPADDKLPVYAEADIPRPQKRSRHKSTEALVSFIDEVLPSRGLYVGHKGTGWKISWHRAFLDFNYAYPGYYANSNSFRNAYYNAKKAREESTSTPLGVQDRCEVKERF